MGKTIIKWIFFISVAIAYARPQKVLAQPFIAKENLNTNWVYYNEKHAQTFPFFKNSHQSPFAIHLTLGLNYGNKVYLKMPISKNTSLFVNNKFVRHYATAETEYFSIDSLRYAVQSDSLHLTFFNAQGIRQPPDASVGYLHRDMHNTMNINKILTRHKNNTAEYIKLLVILVFVSFVVLHSLFPSELKDFYNLPLMLTFRFTDTILAKYRSFTKPQTLVVLYKAGLMAVLLLIFIRYYHNPFATDFLARINPLYGWLILFCGVIFLLFLKFVLISLISFLFGMADKINFYFVEFFRMAIIFYSTLFILITYIMINHLYLLPNILGGLIVYVIIFYLLRFIILFFKLRSTATIKNLHLFSYLCTTELIPMIIGLNFFLNR